MATNFTHTLAESIQLPSGAVLQSGQPVRLISRRNDGWVMVYEHQTHQIGWILPQSLILIPPSPHDTDQAYAQGLADAHLFDPAGINSFGDAHRDLRALTAGWLDVARRILRVIQSNPGSRPVLVTSTHVSS